MTRDDVNAAALALPAVTRIVQWGGSDVYKVGGKVFAICGLGGGLSFKVTEIGFMALTEGGPGRQAPYLARGHWVAVELGEVDAAEVSDWLATSHALVAAKLTRIQKRELGLA
ncbi:MmcQ/YjbR family DNA-binding protein [Phenylobacterium hankyongense]|uniref:MmcQ/YjbR family DNA-binding protein n=1 Tax=Phenylobacterium hankyongense TaxID=1813876 RepID=A0A328AZ36_9CAUL|nr:MmcQ/YjbR family DNA-binding protein [Phenylobacterium hankyongense]RAK58936.1 MmcQ/YjbR family DNA-binding protein [Phenylobacterium hankyongense]